MNIDGEKVREIKEVAPVFIIGCQRSGTSLLYRILSETLNIGFGRDNTLFINYIKRLGKYKDLNKKRNLKQLLLDLEKRQVYQRRFSGLNISSDEFISCLEKREYEDIVRTIYAYWALLHGKTRWGGKTPDYTAHQKTLSILFPDVKIIHIIRDGRDVSLSLARLKWGPNDPYTAAKYWKVRVNKGSSGKQILGKNYTEIKYEDLLKYPEQTFYNIISFLNYSDIDPDRAMNDFRENVIPGINADNAYKWKTKMTPADKRIFEIEAGDILENNGYELLNNNYYEFRLNPIEKGYHQVRDIFIKVKKGYLLRSLTKINFRYKY